MTSKFSHIVSEETKKKISQSLKGNIPWNKGLKGYHPKGVGFKSGHTPWNKGLIGVNLNTNPAKGVNHRNWKGGKSSLAQRIRASSKCRKWRADVLKRDNWTCQTCGIKGHGFGIQTHHVKSIREILNKVNIKNLDINDQYNLALSIDELFDVSNGITLCQECHKLTFKGENNE